MNKKYDQTDRERDQLRRLEQDEANQRKVRQGGMPGRADGQQQASDEPRHQHGGWPPEEDRSSGSGRDRDSGEKLVDEP